MWVYGDEYVAPSQQLVSNNVAMNRLRVGTNITNATATILADDLAVNDDQGAAQNERVGPGRIGFLVPTVIGAGGRGNWTAGAGLTTNLHDSLDNLPPTGTASASNTIKIVNSVSGVSSAEFDLAAYSTLVGPHDSVVLVQPLWRLAVNDLTGTGAGAGRLFSNPDLGAHTALNFEAAAAIWGTEPAGWNTQKGAYAL